MGEVADFFQNLFSIADWPPRWHCGHWSQFHGWLYITSDLMIWSAYFTIPLFIIKYITRKTQSHFVKLYFLFAAFILACGATHFLDAITFWLPIYRLNALVKFFTGVVSWITVFYLYRTLPLAFSLKTSAELEAEIAQRKQAEAQVKELNEHLEQLVIAKSNELLAKELRFSAIIENSFDAISLHDAAFLPIYRNGSAKRMVGWSDADPEHVDWQSRVHPQDKDTVNKMIAEVSANPGKTVPCKFRTRNRAGDYVWIEGNITNRLNEEYVHAIVVNFRDVTETHNIEVQQRKNEKIYREIAANLPGSVVTIVDKNRYFILAEGEGLQRIGSDKTTMEGRREREVLSPDAYKIVAPYRDAAFTGKTISAESSYMGLHFLTRYVPLRDEHKEVYAVMTISIDITEIKQAQHEIQALNDNLKRNVRERTRQLEVLNSELESFSYSVSHDLRAPLRIISGYTEILVADHLDKLPQESIDMMGAIINNTRRMGILIDELLNLSRLGRQQVRKQDTEMSEIVEEVINEQRLLTGSNARFHIGALMPASCDGQLIRHVWVNLISNAIKYSSKEVLPQIWISCTSTEEELIFSVKDNGVGFDMQYSANLFGVFQRLHKRSEYEGAGVGLALVQRIVNRHDGRVWASAEEHKGATFYFSLPNNSSKNGTI